MNDSGRGTLRTVGLARQATPTDLREVDFGERLGNRRLRFSWLQNRAQLKSSRSHRGGTWSFHAEQLGWVLRVRAP